MVHNMLQMSWTSPIYMAKVAVVWTPAFDPTHGVLAWNMFIVHTLRSQGHRAIVDGAAIVQMLKPTSARTFSDYARDLHLYLARKLERVSRIDLVWHFLISLKPAKRAKLDTGMQRHLVGGKKIILQPQLKTSPSDNAGEHD